jgi:hypothetical protein
MTEFSVFVHHRYPSPDDRWAVEVTKRMEWTSNTRVHLRVTDNEGRLLLEVYLGSTSRWGDVEPRSYEVRWQSGTTFLVGGREPGSAARWRGRDAGDVWVVEPVP